jgi:hypothetical protein
MLTVPVSRRLALTALIAALAPSAYGYGESSRTIGSWEERALHQLMNRARVNPSIDLGGCGANCSSAELGGCYGAIAPLASQFSLSHAARFHSASMARNGFRSHDTPFAIRTNIGTLFPESCDGSSSCASSGAGSTATGTRISLFGAAWSGEIIAWGYPTPAAAFYGWLYEAAPSATCAFSIPNGHRWLLLKGTSAVGFGFASNVWTGDFGSATAATPKIPSGSHWGAAGSSAPNQRQSTSVEFWANWYDAAGPLQASVVIDGAARAMALARGSSTNGAWTVTVGGLENGCHRYFFEFVDAGGQTVRYPTTGTLGVGAAGTCADFASFAIVRNDFSGDSRADILLTNNVSGDVAQWRMNGLAISGGAVVGNAGPNYVARTIGDYNGDGRADIALQNVASGDVAIWLMNGSTITAGAVIGNPGSGWIPVASGDLNADSREDLVLQQSGTGNVAAWLMNGLAISSGALVGSPGPAFSLIDVGDFNGDGREDMLLQNGATSAVAAWQMSGLTISTAAIVGSPGPSWVARAAADVNGDGRADILLRNSVTGSIAQWQMNGLTISAGADLGSPGAVYDLVGSGDYNGDGNSDVLLRNSSGTVAVWLLTGGVINGGAVVGSSGGNYIPVAK